MRVLVVEDDTKIADFVVQGLKQAGFAVDHRTNGEDGLHLALTEPCDAAVIDLMLPKLDGLSLIGELRRQKVNTPVIILSARRSVDDRVKGLHTGGDDYLVKPFAFVELLARVQALLRRPGSTVEPMRLAVGDLVIDMLSRQVTRMGKVLELQNREFCLLEYLARNVGRPISRTMILQHVWALDFDPQTNVVEVLVSRLRTKLDTGFPSRLIHTVRGVGYVLRAA